MDEQIANMGQTSSTVIDLAVSYGPRVLVAALILLAGYYVGRWAGRALDRLLQKLDLDATVRILLTRIASTLVVLLFAIMALQNLGVELLPLIAGLGIAGAGIALALQGVLGNLAAGLTIIFTRPFKVGEYISIVGEEGLIEYVSLFTTTLSHPDRSRVIIPNRKIVGEILHNFGRLRQLDVRVALAHVSDIDGALHALRGLLATQPRLLAEPRPVVAVLTMTEAGVQIAVRPWTTVADFGDASSELTRAALQLLQARGFAAPVPQRQVRLLGADAT